MAPTEQDPRQPRPHRRKRRSDAFTAEQRAAAVVRRNTRQRQRLALRKQKEPGYQPAKRAAERRRYHQKKGRRRRLRNVDTVERQFIAGGFYVASLNEIQRPTFAIIDASGRKRWETLEPDLA